MNKLDLVNHVALKTHLNKKVAEDAIDGLFDLIIETLVKGEQVKISGFGTFEIRHRKARTGVRPGTKEKIKIPATKAIAFKPAGHLKEAVK